MSAKDTLLGYMETEIKKPLAHKDFEEEGFSEEDEAFIWSSIGKEWSEQDDPPTEGEEWENALKKYMQDKFKDFHSDFSHKAEDKGSYLHVARCISVNDVDDFVGKISKGEYLSGYGGVGVYWSWDTNNTECYWGKSGQQPVIINGLVDVRNIDIKSTIMTNLHPSLGERETEIKVRDNNPIRILNLKSHGKMLWEGDQEVKAKSFLKRVGALK